jgi:hypothetical protein
VRVGVPWVRTPPSPSEKEKALDLQGLFAFAVASTNLRSTKNTSMDTRDSLSAGERLAQPSFDLNYFPTGKFGRVSIARMMLVFVEMSK